MAYTDFNFADLQKKLGLKNRREYLFEAIQPIVAGARLREALETAEDLPIKSEKARSEWIVVPVLDDLRKRNDRYFTIYSGDRLDVDEKKGLKGECDFILAKETGSLSISAPILQLVEAKKGDIEAGIPQCAAQMLGARLFNEEQGIKLEHIYGCVTTGKDWQFLRLTGELLIIDKNTYYISEIDELLGVFQTIIDYYKVNI